MTDAIGPMLRFHWRSGARVALRANGIVGAMIVFVFALDIDAVSRVRSSALSLVARGVGSEARVQLAAISVALATLAMPRVTLGATGWMRSLPVARMTSRRAATLALASVQVFTMAVGVLSILGAGVVYRAPLDLAKIVSLPLIYIGAAFVVLPVELLLGRGFALAALALAIPGHWLSSGLAVAALILADRFSGGIVPFRRKGARTSRRARIGGGPALQWLRFTLRTLPRATLAASFLLPALFTMLSALIVLHNPDIDRATATRTIRIGGMLAVVALAGGIASSIVRARPAWPWARSLPWSARQRVTADTVLHAAALSVIPGYFAFLDWRSALVLAMVVPAIAATAAAAIRGGARRQTSAAGEITTVGVVFGALIAFWPWTAALTLVATPLIFTHAVRRDQRLITTHWEELHHDATGDPAWMQAS